jgi:uncharacterized protein YhaN
MRIERIELDGFGHFAAARWELAAGLTVLLGHNEAGKTTLLNAIRALLFGFEATREGKTWYPALAGGRRGGRLLVVTESGERWTIERHGERGGQGTLTVRAPNGNQGGIETLDRLLGRADRELFSNVFAFGLGELESFATLSSEGVTSRIYGAGSGLGGVSALGLERTLRDEQESVYKVRGRDQVLNRLLARIEELRGRIAELERQPAEHEAAVAELEQLRERRAELRRQRLAAAERGERLRRLLAAQPAAATLSELERALADGDERGDALPADVEAALDRRLTEQRVAERELAAADEEIGELERELAGLRVDEALLAAAPEIVALRDERLIHEQRTVHLREAEAAVAGHAAELAEQLRRVGGWDEERLLGLDDSIASLEATRAAEQRMAAAQAAADRLGQRVEAGRVDLAAAERDALTQGALAGDELERRRQALGRLTELDRRLASLDERERLLAELGAASPQASSPGLALPVAVGVIVLLLAGLAGAFGGAPLVGVGIGLPLALLAALVVRRATEPKGRPALSGAISGETRTSERAALQAERVELVRLAGLPPDARGDAIAAASNELAVLVAGQREANVRRARLVERRESLERLEAESAAAERARAQAREAWREWLGGHQLPDDASPEVARQILAAVSVARRAAERRQEQQRRASVIGDASAAFEARLDRLLAALGRPTPTEAGLRATAVIGLGEELERASVADRRRLALTTDLLSRRSKREALAAVFATATQELAGYLARCGAADAEELRVLAAATHERRELQQRIRETRAGLVATAGSEAALPELLAEAGRADPARLTAEREEAVAEARRLEEEEAQALTREGALVALIERLEAADELGEARQELAMAQAQAAEAAHRWSVRAVALGLLAETRHRYERERQPQVVQDAERYFATITDGRYPRIVAPAGESSVLIEAEHGSPLATDQLSRGTAEQLYLALRFGLIEQFARAAEPLPVIMDDILVNFDPERAARAARAIGQLASRHQVIFFTCHPRIAELLDPDGVVTQQLS